MASRPLTLGFITLIQALCQQSFGLTLPQNCFNPGACLTSDQTLGLCALVGLLLFWSTNRRRFLGQFGLFVRVETGKEVKSLASPDSSKEAEGISEHLTGPETCDLRRIRAKKQVHLV